MTKNYAHDRNGGHSPGHVRETFLRAIDAFANWVGRGRGIGPEPKVQHEVDYEPIEISLSEACGLVWNCTDTLPSDEVEVLQDCGLASSSYASAARAMRRWISKRTQRNPP
jgi:hypothetical protein